MSQNIYLSIVIPAYNEADCLSENLLRIKDALNTALPPELGWEIIVCDNNSTDGTAEVAEQEGAAVVFEPVNQIGRARNTGAQAALGRWLLFLDADSYPTPAFIGDLYQLIETGDFIGCGTTVQIDGGTLFNKLRMERLNPIFRILNIAGGACLLSQHEAFRQIGGFSLNLYAYEEFDFIRKLKKYGRKRGKKFTVLYRHPVITSGRKGVLQPQVMLKMVGSNLLAMFLYLFRAILPTSWIKTLARKGLGFWYDERN